MTEWFLASVHLLALGIGLGAIWARGRALGSELDTAGLQRAFYADNFWGFAALLWLSTGIARAFGGFEKGTSYYLHNGLLLAKMTVLAVILIMELPPMIALVRWRRATRQGIQPDTGDALSYSKLSVIQAGLLVLMVFLATGMARGYGAGAW